MRKVTLTMSWDDGSPSDMRLAELLSKYDIAATFYIPQRNIEGLPVLSDSEIRSLSQAFEIGAHTIDHVRLSCLSKDQEHYQISNSKEWLEDITGNAVKGFCFPGGEYRPSSVESVKQSGYFYSRTTENFRNDIDSIYRMPTTLQLFNHKGHVLLFNMMKYEDSLRKISKYYPILFENNLLKRLEYILNFSLRNNLDYIHLWGHSWELDECQQWNLLEDFFRIIYENRESISFKTNYQSALSLVEEKT